jgi:anti-sigma factor RsiW
MTGGFASGRPGPIADEDLHAFIDGELGAADTRAMQAALQADAALAARAAAFTADKHALAALYAPIAEAPIPHAWRARIEAATAPAMPRFHTSPSPLSHRALLHRPLLHRALVHRPVWRGTALALAAAVALFALASLLRPAPADTILADAAAARRDEIPALIRLTGAALADPAARSSALRHATGLPVSAPDLLAQHWHLVELETYAHAAALRYRSDTAQSLTLYIRRSAGPPRFDLLRDGTLRTCIWQDEVVGAVMTGDMTAGQMMRVASAAYLALNL